MTSGGQRITLTLLAMLASLAACEAPTGYADLEKNPEADLLYPGSEPLSDGGHGPEDAPDGPLTAVYWQILGTDGSASEILDFYDMELGERGWEPGGGSSGIPTTSELDAHAWHQGEAIFRLAIKDPDEWHRRLPGSDRFATLYEISLIGESNTDP